MLFMVMATAMVIRQHCRVDDLVVFTNSVNSITQQYLIQCYGAMPCLNDDVKSLFHQPLLRGRQNRQRCCPLVLIFKDHEKKAIHDFLFLFFCGGNT